jgi:hypothetical protein
MKNVFCTDDDGVSYCYAYDKDGYFHRWLEDTITGVVICIPDLEILSDKHKERLLKFRSTDDSNPNR